MGYADYTSTEQDRAQELAGMFAKLTPAQQDAVAALMGMQASDADVTPPQQADEGAPAPETVESIHTGQERYKASKLLRSAFAWRNSDKALVAGGRVLKAHDADIRMLFATALEHGWSPPDVESDPLAHLMPDSAQESQAHDAPATPPQESGGVSVSIGGEAKVAPSVGKLTGRRAERLSKALERLASDEYGHTPVSLGDYTVRAPGTPDAWVRRGGKSLKGWAKDNLTALFSGLLLELSEEDRLKASVSLANALGVEGERAHAFNGYRVRNDWLEQAASSEQVKARVVDAS